MNTDNILLNCSYILFFLIANIKVQFEPLIEIFKYFIFFTSFSILSKDENLVDYFLFY